MRRLWTHGYPAEVLAAAAAVAALYVVFLKAPPPAEWGMAESQRIFYVHVAAAWVGLAVFGVLFVASLLVLWKKASRFDHLALAAGETGVVFMTAVLATGVLWARDAWGVWWTWDPRLTTSLLLWLMYAAYLALRRNVAEPGRQARFAAVYAVAAFVDVPLVFFSIRWWRGQHPVLIDQAGTHMAPTVLYTLLLACLAFSLLGGVLLDLRRRLHRLEAGLEAAAARIDECRRLR